MTKYLIVGLGNIGAEYSHTRHNIGFDVVEALALKHDAEWQIDRLAAKASLKIKGKQLILIKPTTYMNLSGKALKYWMDKENVAIDNILVIVDDLALPLERFRVRGDGSDAGHNGLKDIQFMLNTTKYPRLRFGIGNEFTKGQQVDFVLGKWDESEILLVKKKIEVATQIVEKFVLEGITHTMNFCNNLIIAL
jgi:peptidyl-tRNA hydrolase, PTH1 family